MVNFLKKLKFLLIIFLIQAFQFSITPLSDSLYFIHVSSNNLYPYYYNSTITLQTGNDNSEVTADWGDVVNLYYSLYTDAEHTTAVPGNTGILLEYVYLRRSQSETVPSEVYQALPMSAAENLQQVYLQAFIDEIIGMQTIEEKSFMIAAADAYGDKDLFYTVTLLTILYDASGPLSTSAIIESTTYESTAATSHRSTTTAIETSTTIPNISAYPDLFIILLFIVTTIGIFRRGKKGKEKNF